MNPFSIPGYDAAARQYDNAEQPDDGGCRTCGIPLNDADGKYCPEHDPDIDRIEVAPSSETCNEEEE